MAKPQPVKQPAKTSEALETNAAEPAPPPTEVTAAAAANPPVAAAAKKEPARPKKPVPAKNGSLLPSAYKLEQLKAAVTAAGGTEKLLLIMHHVEEAGGKAEVTESIEAYRVLKTVLDE